MSVGSWLICEADNLTEGNPHKQWRFENQLCAVYGLLPEELRHLRIKSGINGSELVTTYRMLMDGTKWAKIETRRLQLLLLPNADGPVIDWNLQVRLEIGLKAPAVEPWRWLWASGESIETSHTQ